MSEVYTCAACKGVFTKEHSDEDTMSESRDIFGEVPDDQLEIVCDDCFNAMRPHFNQGVNYE